MRLGYLSAVGRYTALHGFCTKRKGRYEKVEMASFKGTKWYVSCFFLLKTGTIPPSACSGAGGTAETPGTHASRGRTGDTGGMPRQNADVLVTLDLTIL